MLSLVSDEGVFVDTNGKVTKNVVVQWGESPTSVGKTELAVFILCQRFTSDLDILAGVLVTAYISTGQIMGWGNKAIEIRAADTGHLDGVFMHKKAQKLKFLCERNDKVN